MFKKNTWALFNIYWNKYISIDLSIYLLPFGAKLNHEKLLKLIIKCKKVTILQKKCMSTCEYIIIIGIQFNDWLCMLSKMHHLCIPFPGATIYPYSAESVLLCSAVCINMSVWCMHISHFVWCYVDIHY